jgi:hypothetical protein
MTGHDACRETVPPAVRDDMLEEYRNQCQGCGRCGPAAGGLATLHVHHITRDPQGMGEHAPENLTVLCRRCHSLLHQQTTTDDVPVEITEEDLTVLLPHDLEILQLLAESGPARTGEIASNLSMDLTVTAVRERLWLLMGLDNVVASRERQVIDQDADTGEWGLTGQIEHSSRGRIPNDVQLLWQRIEDELVRQALDRGCDRNAVMAVLDLSRRSTFYKEKRGRAYEFPLDAIDRRGGRPQAKKGTDERGDAVSSGDGPEVRDAQQQLDAVGNGSGGHSDEDVPVGEGEAAGDEVSGDEQSSGQSPAGDGGDPTVHLQDAIRSLQALEAEL